jgi:NADPH-dependent curcumin reductase CurA
LVGALGIAGLAAYVSFYEFVKEPRAGKKFWVSAPSGASGQIVSQIAKLAGMKVIGSTGSDGKG